MKIINKYISMMVIVSLLILCVPMGSAGYGYWSYERGYGLVYEDQNGYWTYNDGSYTHYRYSYNYNRNIYTGPNRIVTCGSGCNIDTSYNCDIYCGSGCNIDCGDSCYIECGSGCNIRHGERCTIHHGSGCNLYLAYPD